jgi:3'-phosphoadenosine 5'-phosphosulfate sulfotransferase
MTNPPKFAPVLFVDIRESKTLFPLKRRQRWYFVILVEGNMRTLATSEMYTNFADCEAAARLACDFRSRVFLRLPGQGMVLLRDGEAS